jgi:hypothetical protein
MATRLADLQEIHQSTALEMTGESPKTEASTQSNCLGGLLISSLVAYFSEVDPSVEHIVPP